MSMPTERDQLRKLRMRWRVVLTGPYAYVYTDEETQVARLTSQGLAQHIVDLHNAELDKE